jgi:hypothetical protein
MLHMTTPMARRAGVFGLILVASEKTSTLLSHINYFGEHPLSIPALFVQPKPSFRIYWRSVLRIGLRQIVESRMKRSDR